MLSVGTCSSYRSVILPFAKCVRAWLLVNVRRVIEANMESCSIHGQHTETLHHCPPHSPGHSHALPRAGVAVQFLSIGMNQGHVETVAGSKNASLVHTVR